MNMSRDYEQIAEKFWSLPSKPIEEGCVSICE